MVPESPSRHIRGIVVSFLLSTLFTALFIRAYDGYVSERIMLLSGCVAGGKWAIQMVAGWCLLGKRKWVYLSTLATTCLIGSTVLLPYAALSGGAGFFFGSLIGSIVVMAASLVGLQRRAGFSWRWQALWFGLLAVAVTLQLTVVFHLL